MSYATATDVENRLGRALDESETTIVNTRLDDAEMDLKFRIPDLDDKVAASAEYRQRVVRVEADMVLRLIKNPDGYVQETDGNYSYTISSNVASGKLDVLPEEWALLGMRAGMFQIVPVLDCPWATPTELRPYTMEDAIRDGWV